VWHIKRYQKEEIKLPKKHEARLQKYVHNDYTYYLEFIKKSLEILSKDTTVIVIWTYFFNKVFKDQSKIERDFLQTLMLRVEYELREREENGIIIYDQVNINKIFEHYNDIYINGKFVKKYYHIKDSMSFEISTFSSGIQIVDYVSNIIFNSLKRGIKGRGYTESLSIFEKILKPKIRRKPEMLISQTGFVPLYLKKHRKGLELLKKIKENLDINI